MVKVLWNVVQLAAHGVPQGGYVESDVHGLINRLGCPGLQSLAFDFRDIKRSVALWTRLLSEIGLRVNSVREIPSGCQIKLACGIVLNFYTTGTLMAQGRYGLDQVVAVEALRSILDSIKGFYTLSAAKLDCAGLDEEF